MSADYQDFRKLCKHVIASRRRRQFLSLRRHKAGDIKITDFERIKRQFKAVWQSFTIIEIHKEIIALIDGIIEKYALRGADSIHLSTALWLRHTIGGEVLFVAADVELLLAAKKEKMQTCNPQD